MAHNNDDHNPFCRRTMHNMHRRARMNDYSQPGTYMITIVVAGRHPYFGRLVADPDPRIELSALGHEIAENEMRKMHHFYPNVYVWCYVIMPDHIHMILRVDAPFTDGSKHLGRVLAGFKGGCTKAWRRLSGSESLPLFEGGYHDSILCHEGQLEAWRRYLYDNPRRLYVKRTHPDFFTVLSDVEICGQGCHIVGNRFLLNIPDKEAVIVRSADTPEQFQAKKAGWLACAERGGVLVSAAISQREKQVMREALDRGYRVIVLRENGFQQYYKPHGEAFDACARGQMLQVCPWEYHFDRRSITREQCLKLNGFAAAIVDGKQWL